MKVTVIVAAHIPYEMPVEACYLPVQVGKAGKKSIGYCGDDTGDHISEKNPYYCELTGLYWMWKNVDSDYLGIVHYRRYLGKLGLSRNPFDRILTEQEILEYMKETDILLPKKRKYYIESVYDHYAHTHYAEQLDLTREVIGQICPEYSSDFDKVMKRRSAHMFNMFVMSRERCREYCSWVFQILENLEKRLDLTIYDEFQARLFGRISELLLDVWLEKNQYSYKEVPIVYIDGKKTVRKLFYFMESRLLGKKYSKSV